MKNIVTTQSFLAHICIGSLFILLTACQANLNHEQEVVKKLPTNPKTKPTKLALKQALSKASAGDPRYAPVRDTSAAVMHVPTGSLFNQDQYVGLFLHKHQYQIGDMVQVVLEEQTRASKQQNLSKDKSTEMSLDPLELKAGFLQVDRGDVRLNHQQESNFNSSSDSRQSNSLEGVINVFVSDIIENGNLVVAGEKWIKLNEGDEYIRVYGELRTQDISANNTISSTKLGNARIEYSGAGSLQENQQDSLISKILSVFR